MKPPRLRIAWIMMAVAVVALDIGVVRGFYDYAGVFGLTVVYSPLPTANVLAMVALAGRRDRRFVVGFLTCGLFAMAGILAWVRYDERGFLAMHFAVLDRTREFLGLDYSGWRLYAMHVVGPAVQVVPQLAVALIGGIPFAGVRRAPRPAVVAEETG